MKKIKFTLDYYPTPSKFMATYGVNRFYAGVHWRERKQSADVIHWLTRQALGKAGVKPGLWENPVRITFSYNDRYDLDNHGAVEKMIVDGLKGYILPDDNRKWYAERVSKFYDGDKITVEVEEIEHGQKSERKA